MCVTESFIYVLKFYIALEWEVLYSTNNPPTHRRDKILCIFYRRGIWDRAIRWLTRVTQEVTGRAGSGTEFLIPIPVLGLLDYAACIQ